jgi:hypothetical protein
MGAAPLKYRKKPVVIEAMQWDGKNHVDWVPSQDFRFDPGGNLHLRGLDEWPMATLGDWIIKGIKGEFYPCKSDVFEATYEPAD